MTPDMVVCYNKKRRQQYAYMVTLAACFTFAIYHQYHHLSHRTIQLHSVKSLNLHRIETSVQLVPKDVSAHGIKRCFLRKHCMNYFHMPSKVCEMAPKLFIFVFSHSSNPSRRLLVRETWANMSVFAKHDIRVVFIIGGANNNTKPLPALYTEARKYNDMYIIDIMESFYNLTLKGVFGLHVATHFCPEAKFVMKTDDDMLINMFSLLHLIGSLNKRGVIMGKVWPRPPVFRTGRYAVSRDAYDRSRYPPFCSGSGWVMSMDVARIIYELAMYETKETVVHLDDPYLTGILGDKAGVTIVAINQRYLVYSDVFSHTSDRDLDKYIFWHINDVDQHTTESKTSIHRKMWQRLLILNLR